MPMSAMKAAFKLPSAARFINKEGRDDFRKKPCRAVTSFPFREGFLSPVRGTEGVVKTFKPIKNIKRN